MRIALVPLDERPVNIQLPRQVAAIAGVDLMIPPAAALPSFRTPADVDALHAWLRELAAAAEGDAVDRLIVCIDTLVHGGIIPARITADSPRVALDRLDFLRELHELRAVADTPALVITAASLVMRASDSFSTVEEPEYWSTYGRALHAFGGALHHALEADLLPGDPPQVPALAVPRAEQSDFERRRLRNHIINLAALGLHEEGVIDALAMTADDTAAFSAGSVEQAWLRHWARALPRGGEVMMYPGADEVGAVLVARALVAAGGGRPTWRIVCGEDDGLTRIPNFENAPVHDSLVRQIVAAGGIVAEDDGRVDAVLVAHAPDPEHGDCFGSVPRSDPAAVEATVLAVREALASGVLVALADVRYSNGSDPALVDRLAAEGLLLRLTSYGGWNTAGNAIGGAVASATAWWVGRRDGTADPRALREALLTRILDDHAYQSGIRPTLHESVFGSAIGPVDDDTEARALHRIGAELQSRLDDLLAGEDSWTVASVALPWHRSFEIDIALARR